MGWAEGEVSYLWIITSLWPGPASRCRAFTGFPCGIYFFFFWSFLPLPMLGRFLSSLTYFIHRKGCPALGSVIEAVPLVCHSITGSQGCLAWEKLHGHVPKSALHASLFLPSLIRVHTMKTTATASFSSPPPHKAVLSLFFFLWVFLQVNRFSAGGVLDLTATALPSCFMLLGGHSWL